MKQFLHPVTLAEKSIMLGRGKMFILCYFCSKIWIESVLLSKPSLYIVFFLPEALFLNFKEPRNLFQGIDSASLSSLAGRYDNPISTRFLAPTDCSKIPALLLALGGGGGGGGGGLRVHYCIL